MWNQTYLFTGLWRHVSRKHRQSVLNVSINMAVPMQGQLETGLKAKTKPRTTKWQTSLFFPMPLNWIPQILWFPLNISKAASFQVGRHDETFTLHWKPCPTCSKFYSTIFDNHWLSSYPPTNAYCIISIPNIFKAGPDDPLLKHFKFWMKYVSLLPSPLLWIVNTVMPNKSG